MHQPRVQLHLLPYHIHTHIRHVPTLAWRMRLGLQTPTGFGTRDLLLSQHAPVYLSRSQNGLFGGVGLDRCFCSRMDSPHASLHRSDLLRHMGSPFPTLPRWGVGCRRHGTSRASLQCRHFHRHRRAARRFLRHVDATSRRNVRRLLHDGVRAVRYVGTGVRGDGVLPEGC